jgi:phospholipase D1/2
MIVDDTQMIVGSANINDRSMWGNRDSELAVYIQGPTDLEVTYGGQTFAVNKAIFDFRSRLFVDHFGITLEEATFPQSVHCWQLCWNILRINTQFYDLAFKSFPSSLYRNFDKLEGRDKLFSKQAFKDLENLVQGNVVEYSYQFLIDEPLEDAKNQELGLRFLPMKTFY